MVSTILELLKNEIKKSTFNAFHVEFFNIHTKHYLITLRIFMSQVYPKCNKNMFIVFYVEYVKPYLVR